MEARQRAALEAAAAREAAEMEARQRAALEAAAAREAAEVEARRQAALEATAAREASEEPVYIDDVSPRGGGTEAGGAAREADSHRSLGPPRGGLRRGFLPRSSQARPREEAFYQ